MFSALLVVLEEQLGVSFVPTSDWTSYLANQSKTQNRQRCFLPLEKF